ncbi:putative (LysW)-aminoadipate/(LysW)-glutamate kinase [Nitrosopumilaceae archaeon]|nr:[LysW]-aminoadipate/[LysW]-glutamate kinase [Nitrosopumilus sp.]CAI9830887.1 putative (LysW)-aminoadipate/(LysW)-glutamate kinase [Nitrosopumilaceae archaeon]MDA7941294.1 [LysW]-aminoadipate/[LysW]-glutamate kinase [Nitrosopumilus sp.]MDA7945305.1 [LysW]-aminoadipate/[LysW]-glutamate kinase [Nitrosopumilus sp.]MDA7955281.1 [LysW]-aminoadipate/[LysW]-glutamate kinase [Nitrosopumilus sp.]
MITIKIGGSIVDGLHTSAVGDIAAVARGEGVVLVHGGGKEVTGMCGRLGVEPRFVTSPSGKRSRYTDAETAEIFTMVMAGRVNKGIVRMLQEAGVNAVGVTGADARLMEAERKGRLVIMNERGRKQAIEGGYTGKVTSVNGGFLRMLLDGGYVPVVAPVALGASHEFLNVDGDRAAAHVAGATKSDRIIFITDVDGYLRDGATVPRIPAGEVMAERERAGPGMEKKLLAAAEALGMGVGEALIANGGRADPVSSALAHEGCTVVGGG